ncbi:hypothetical protein GO009_03665 [Muricauda sp. TY007]|uniref:Ig-like domain-containing protein n=1 Tax=Allomuricauda sp. TY007 TaxID=2683200 RepID=UPI0013BF5EB4|nr:hypothetical protein [Muricauda sp. TY007]NDV15111.1 hypothetical protein [Muricauda sp. TY007]
MRKATFYSIILIITIISCDKSETNVEIEKDTNPKSEETAILSIKSENNTISSLEFGEVVASNNKTLSIILNNTGNSTLSITAISFPEGFNGNWVSGEIPSNSQKTIEITFSPMEIVEYSGNISITSNATSPISSFSLSGTGISDEFEGDISLNSNEELEEFIAKGYKSISGKLSMSSSKIESIEPLKELSTIGWLELWGTNCSSLKGLENIYLKFGIQLVHNHNLINLDYFPNSDNIISVNLFENDKLESINALSKFTSFSFFQTKGNKSLQNLDGLQNITSISSDLNIRENDLIENLDSLSKLLYVGGHLWISRNASLYSYCGLIPLLSSDGLKGTFIIPKLNSYNPYPASEILDKCEFEVPEGEFYGDIIIGSQNELDYIATREYTKITGNLKLVDDTNGIENYGIKDLSGLSSLQNITGDLVIVESFLENLNGLENLETVGGDIRIERNQQLYDFCGIVPLIQSGNYITLQYVVTDNLYNPTDTDLQLGNCTP